MSSVIDEIVKLQSASAEQTAASQALSQEVAGKIGAIDKKVLEAEQRTDAAIANVNAAIPHAFDNEMRETVYINNETGNDSTGDGTSAKPYFSIKKAIESRPDNTFININGNLGTKENPHLIDQTINVQNKNVRFYNLEHIKFAVGTVFVGDIRSIVSWPTRYGGGGSKFYITQTITLYKGAGGFLFECVNAHYIYAEPNITINVIGQSYTIDRLPARLMLAGIQVKNTDGSAFTGTFNILDANLSGACIYEIWRCVLGNNFDDAGHGLLHGKLKVVTVNG